MNRRQFLFSPLVLAVPAVAVSDAYMLSAAPDTTRLFNLAGSFGGRAILTDQNKVDLFYGTDPSDWIISQDGNYISWLRR